MAYPFFPAIARPSVSPRYARDMANPVRKRATWDDLDALPREVRAEIVDGEIQVIPRPGPDHAESASDLGAILVPLFKFGHHGGPGGWVILDEPLIAFGGDIRSPDLAGWRKERYARPERGPFSVIPDWVCEILSPSTAIRDRTEKLPLYARYGVGYYWIVDPVGCSLEVYKLGPEGYVVALVVAGDQRVRAAPFDAIDSEGESAGVLSARRPIELDLRLVFGDRLDATKPE